MSSKSTTNRVTTRGFSSYEISNIDDIIIISEYNDPPFDDEGVNIDYFIDGSKFTEQTPNIKESQALVPIGGAGSATNLPISQEEIFSETYSDPKFYSYQEYVKTIESMKKNFINKTDTETKSIVVLHFDLLYHKDVDKSNCASRKRPTAVNDML